MNLNQVFSSKIISFIPLYFPGEEVISNVEILSKNDIPTILWLNSELESSLLSKLKNIPKVSFMGNGENQD